MAAPLLRLPIMPAHAADFLCDIDSGRIPPAEPALFATARGGRRGRAIANKRHACWRFLTAAEAVVVPLAEDGFRCGAPFRGVLADLSDDGLRLLHTRLVAAPLLAVRLGLPEDGFTVVVRVARSVTARSHFEYAGPFVML